VGMTYNDFIDKWLVLGTESKATRTSQSFIPDGATERPITGEKGIGRLAIALLGDQTLILTRAVREDGTHDLVVALVHWGLFEIPGLNLDDVEVPVATVKDGKLPDNAMLADLRQQLVDCVERVSQKKSINLQRILDDIDGFQPDLESVYLFLSEREDTHLSLAGHGTGTHFLVAPTNPIIRLDLDEEEREQDYGFRKHLLGFSDAVFSEETRVPAIATSFRRWRPGDLSGEELLDPNTFFTREELSEKSDHLLSGSVDEHGQFSGTLRVYDTNYDGLTIPWNGNRGLETSCGPFTITFGYLMGRGSESRLSPEEWNDLNTKLYHVGGLYIYRDDIRILPYGDYSFDWVDVEKRRNKGSGYYFFSFRRMFGAVSLTRRENSELVEKAGREGFQKNEAHRQLREIVINLLLYLAAEFFRKDGTNTELFETTQAEMRKRAAALERQLKQSATKRKKFSNGLAAFSDDLDAGLPSSEISALRLLTRSRLDAAAQIADQDKAAAALIRAEQEAITALANLRTKYTRKRPNGVAMGRDVQRGWDGYVVERAKLEENLFAPFEDEIGRTLGAVASQARVYVDQRKRLEERIKLLATERRRELADAARQANTTASDTRQTVFKITEKARQALEETITSIQADLNRTDLRAVDPDRLEKMRKGWEDRLTDIESRHRDALMAARDMLSSLAENLRGSDGSEPAQVMQAMEERMMALEEQADEDFEMVQLGLAVAIINHEFAASIRRVRRSVQELGQISRRSDALRPLYESIRSNFEHLDGHLNLFTPLQRRLHRTSQEITGRSIRNYIDDLFSSRLQRHKVVLKVEPNFLDASTECYPSTLYPAVINIIDNALFWLKDIPGERIIFLDADPDGILISNNGPSVEVRDFQRMFERGFSRKVGGRGLGLFISARALEAENMTLGLEDPPRPGANVTFRIGATMKAIQE
jgi:signal transduction histidine kinase